MVNEHTRRHGHFIRIGGVAILVGFVIHIVANGFLKTFPPDDPTLPELRAYLAAEAGTWALVHGLRYIAFACIALFAAALFTRTCRVWNTPATGWGLFGLLGAALLITNGVITNGIETLAFLDFDRLSDDPKLFWLLFHLTRVLFTAEVVTWGLFMGGFSVAGWLSSTLPRWLAVLGLVSATGSVACGVFIVSIMTDGWAVILVEIAPLGGLAWFLITGVLLIVRGAAGTGEVPAA